MTKLNILLEAGADGKFAYYQGQVLKGTVEVYVNDSQKYRGLYIELFGKAKAEWREHSWGSKRGTRHYRAEEVYLNLRSFLSGQSSGPTLHLSAGVTRYNFNFQLPPQLPYSLKVHHGEIFYRMRVVLDIPWATDKEVYVPLTIIPCLNLSLYPNLSTPCSLEKFENFFSFGSSKPLKIIVMLPFIGFMIGQEIPITIRYENESKVDVLNTHVKLKQHITIHAVEDSFGSVSFFHRNSSKVYKQDVARITGGGAKSGETQDVALKLKIHPVMCSNEMLCQIIVVSYHLNVEVQVSGMHVNPKIHIPVTVGNMRFENQQQPAPPSVNPMPMMLPSAPNGMYGGGPTVPSAPTDMYKGGTSAPVEMYNGGPSAPFPVDMYNGGPSAPFPNNDLPPSFEEAEKIIGEKNGTSMQQSMNIGWGIPEKH